MIRLECISLLRFFHCASPSRTWRERPVPAILGIISSFFQTLHPIAEILARMAAIVPVVRKFFREPDRMNIDKTQSELTALKAPGSIDIRNIVYNLYISVNLFPFLLSNDIGFRIEPERMITQRADAQGVAFAGAYYSLRKLLLLDTASPRSPDPRKTIFLRDRSKHCMRQ